MSESPSAAAVSARPASSRQPCYHCGLPVPDQVDIVVRVDGALRPMCCMGCQAVAQAIVDGHLTEYYRYRDALPQSPREALPDALRDIGLFDHPDLQKSFVQPIGEHEREASLILEGITCSACIWLNEKHIAQQRGVTAVDINYATRRARVRWDERHGQLSEILAAVADIGYRAHPYDASRSEQLAQKERRGAVWRLFVAGFGMMQVMMYALPAYIADDGTMSVDVEQLMRWASLLLTLPVVLYSAGPFFRGAWRDLRLRRVGMDVPVALGVGSAFAASVWATLTGGGAVYFDSVAMFVFFLLSGRFLEMVARQRSVRDVEALAKALPAFAQRLCAYPSAETERVPVSSLVAGDLLRVKAGETLPADGIVVDGSSSVDESLLTGECRPLPKTVGSEVTGGSINRASPLLVRVSQVGERARLAVICQLMARAQTEKPRVVVLADRAAGWFVASLLVLAMATACVWAVVDPARALWVFVSVLVVSCPCALSLATPAALTAANGALSRLGLLATRGHAIETLARATHFVFDKTGTLTRGRLELSETIALGKLDEAAALRLAAALERSSEHAVGAGLRAALGTTPVAAVAAERVVAGQGVEARIDGVRHRIGRIDFVADLVGRPPDAAQPIDRADPQTVVGLGSEYGWIALFRLRDELRPAARALVEALQGAGRHVCILSGDTAGAVSEAARNLGVSAAFAALTPQGKHEFIVELQRQGAIVAMVGDGVNDAPVLAQAQVSIAMGSGTDLARTQGDLVLLSDDLGRIAQGFMFARLTASIIRQNLIWALSYNALAIPAAMLGWVTPWLAGIGMSASSLVVVLNALRLSKAGRRDRELAVHRASVA